MKTRIALIGFMGAGKTAVGKALAGKLGKEFIELDSLIEAKAARSIPEIFEQDGEIAFRELEIEVIKETAGKKNAVIACGGGIVLNKINIDRLKEECVIVYLTASPSVILRRTAGNDRRPLLRCNRFLQVKELLKYRKPFYERAGEIKINTSRLGIASIVENTIEKLKKHEGFTF